MSVSVVPAAEVLDELAELLAECPPLADDPARATGLAATVLAPAQDPGADRELALRLPETLEGLGDARAVELLLRVREFGRPIAAGAAAAALERLEARGFPVRALPPLRVIEAWRVEAPAAEAFAIDLGRDHGPESRVFVLLDRREDPAGIVSAGAAGGPCENESLAEIVPTDFLDASPPERVDGEMVAAALLAGCKRAHAAGLEVPAELAVALTVIARPVFGDPEALPLLPVDPTSRIMDEPDEELMVDPEQDEAATRRMIDGLLAEYAEDYFEFLRSHGRPVDPDTDLFVASSMLDYKADYSDGLLGDWTVSELMEFMLEFWPRKVTADHDTEISAPVAVVRFLRFLDERGSLSGASRNRLMRALSELVEPFLDACEDSARWGPAKSLLRAADRTGVDIHDQNAVRAYLASLQSNAPAMAGKAPIQRARTDRRARRKAAKTARRRNRR